jgi:hypothetical protein
VPLNGGVRRDQPPPRGDAKEAPLTFFGFVWQTGRLAVFEELNQHFFVKSARSTTPQLTLHLEG